MRSAVLRGKSAVVLTVVALLVVLWTVAGDVMGSDPAVASVQDERPAEGTLGKVRKTVWASDLNRGFAQMWRDSW